MQPNESTINPKVTNTFSLIIGGQSCIAYRFLVYDLNNNLITEASTEKTPTTIRYDITSVNVLQDMFNIASDNLSDGDEVKFSTDGTLPEPLEVGVSYYVGNTSFGHFNVFETKSDALENENKIDILTQGEGNHSVSVETPLYDGDTLEILLEPNKLEAGNTYKWQVELFANDLETTEVNSEENTLTIPNHNLVTGDTVYVSGDNGLPEPLEKYTTYYVRKIDSNTIALFNYVEGARNDAGRIDIGNDDETDDETLAAAVEPDDGDETTTTTFTNFTVSNVATSEQIPFMVYDNPIVVFESKTITQQSYKFKPIYTHPQAVMISSFTAYIRSEQNPDSVTSSGLQENVRLEYTFDGLLSGQSYDVRFIINTKANQTYSTPWTPFNVDYASPNLGISPDVYNNEDSASVTLRWSGIKQIIGDAIGEVEYVDNFVKSGNMGLHITSDAYLIFSGLNINAGSNPPVFWWNPVRSDFEGKIMRLDNSLTGDYIEIGYNGTNFYETTNGITIDNAPMSIYPEFVYMIGVTSTQLVVNTIGNIKTVKGGE
jgi:hypothetical protein